MTIECCIARARMKLFPSDAPFVYNNRPVDLAAMDDGVEFETWCGQTRVKNADCPPTFVSADAVLTGPWSSKPCPACMAAIEAALASVLAESSRARA